MRKKILFEKISCVKVRCNLLDRIQINLEKILISEGLDLEWRTEVNSRFRRLISEHIRDGTVIYYYDDGTPGGCKIAEFIFGEDYLGETLTTYWYKAEKKKT